MISKLRDVSRLLRGLEEMHVPKLVKEELGGGRKEFSLAEGLTLATDSEIVDSY